MDANDRNNNLDGGFKDFLMFIPIWGEDSHFDSYFSTGLKPPTRIIDCVIAEAWLTKSRMQDTQVETCFPTA